MLVIRMPNLRAYFCESKVEVSHFLGSQSTGAVFQDAEMVNVTLIRLDLRNANLKKSVFPEDTNLENTNLENATFEGAKLEKCWFSEAKLKGTNFNHANLKLAFFQYAHDIELASFKGADLTYAIWADGIRCLERSIGKCVKGK
jgi:uncharacterized protein YjbI with pentapeptide repeats